MLVSLLTLSCGKVVNHKNDRDFSLDISFLLMERQCGQEGGGDSKISAEIKSFYEERRQQFPQAFFFISPRFYDFENPLIISLESLTKSFNALKADPNLTSGNEDLYYLYNGSRRFEDQKCSFKNLTQKKKYDFRPYLNFAHLCLQKYQNEICNEDEYSGMSEEKESWTRTNALGLCQSFSTELNCQAEYGISQRKKTLGEMISRYYSRFQKERYSTLFKLRPGHGTFHCQKYKETNGERTVMAINIFASSFDQQYMTELLKYVEETWTNKDFALKLELVKTYSSDAVTIVPSDKGISYVPDNNNRTVYLSTLNDLSTSKRVFAHEFGHVLGFPDCYIEFFDDSKKELVYYEISKNNTNIMCSLKEGVQVPEEYFGQLAENSCIFQ
ncbi:MAG: hypothetical protein ACXVLQ_00720 [Bacteriovorax sp.]